jgi:hypothetical protein
MNVHLEAEVETHDNAGVVPVTARGEVSEWSWFRDQARKKVRSI